MCANTRPNPAKLMVFVAKHPQILVSGPANIFFSVFMCLLFLKKIRMKNHLQHSNYLGSPAIHRPHLKSCSSKLKSPICRLQARQKRQILEALFWEKTRTFSHGMKS